MAEFKKIMKIQAKMCAENTCESCPLGRSTLSVQKCLLDEDIEASEKIITEWGKSHYLTTNAEKFKELFGIAIDEEASVRSCIFECPRTTTCDYCEYNGKFWDKEFIEPKEGGQ